MLNVQRFLMRLLLVVLISSGVKAQPLQSSAAEEINALLQLLQQSSCRFYRNGQWHSADKAVAHLNQKYAYLKKKNMVHSAEDFIRGAATQSSMSGEHYRVHCADSTEQPSAEWLAQKLTDLRKK